MLKWMRKKTRTGEIAGGLSGAFDAALITNFNPENEKASQRLASSIEITRLIHRHLIAIFFKNGFADAFHFQQFIRRRELTVSLTVRHNGFSLG